MAEAAPVRQQHHEHELGKRRRMDATRRRYQDLRPETEALHELADAGAGLLHPAELPRCRELLGTARHVPQDLCRAERLEPAPLLLLRPVERRTDMIADVPGRRQ